MSYLRLMLKYGFLALIITLVVIGFCHQWVVSTSNSSIYETIDDLPVNEVAIVLGTSKYVKSGRENLFFTYRMDAAANLYTSGKVKHIIISGDNRVKYYNETRDMKKALLERGVPEQVITMDFAGFRTLDSIIRAREVFGQDKLTVISQKFHNQRAIFIAKANGIEAVGFNAQTVSSMYAPKTYLREYLARVKAILDVYILHTQPHFLGDPIKIEIS
ncbi:MAG: ElyC/SanA/YdcF family protein [Bacteroidota bacterium]